MSKIDFYFDFTSPYSFLAWKRVNELPLEIFMKPVMVGSIISMLGGVGPGAIKSKREYLFLDCLRKASTLGIEMTCPKSLPFNPLPYLRAAISLGDRPKLQRDYINFVFEYGWLNGHDYEDSEFFYHRAEESLGLSQAELEEYESNKDSRKKLKLNIKEAVERGVFGVPSFLIKEKVFWGLDSIEFLMNEYQGKDIERENAFIHELDKFKIATQNI